MERSVATQPFPTLHISCVTVDCHAAKWEGHYDLHYRQENSQLMSGLARKQG